MLLFVFTLSNFFVQPLWNRTGGIATSAIAYQSVNFASDTDDSLRKEESYQNVRSILFRFVLLKKRINNVTASTETRTEASLRTSLNSLVAAVAAVRCRARAAIGQSPGAPAQVLEGMTRARLESRRSDTVSIARHTNNSNLLAEMQKHSTSWVVTVSIALASTGWPKKIGTNFSVCLNFTKS